VSPLDPKRQALLRSSLDLPGGVECDATLRYVGQIRQPGCSGLHGFDLRLGWRPKPPWELSLVGQNSLHERHAEFGAAAARREIEPQRV